MKLRASWVILLAVLLVTLIVPGLRELVKVGLHARSYYGLFAPSGSVYGGYGSRAAEYVHKHAPNDPEMLMAAGIIGSPNAELLAEAAERGNSGVAWAAYLPVLLNAVPRWASPLDMGCDPADPKCVAATNEYLRQQQVGGLPDHLQPADVEKVMTALHAWEAVEPENGLPLALEVKYLAVALQPEAARARLEAADASPKVTCHETEQYAAVAKLLARTGVPGPEAALTAAVQTPLALYARFREVARVGQYNGYLARMQGRGDEALRWWQTTANLGRKLQESSETELGFLVGVASEGIGAAPAWKWRRASTVKNGPLMGGAIYYGPYHEFYAARIGADQDAQLRDRLVTAKVRSSLLRQDFSRQVRRGWPWLAPLGITLLGLAATLVLLAFYLAVAGWRRGAAKGATTLRSFPACLLALLSLLPLGIALLIVLHRGGLLGAFEGGRPERPVLIGMALTLLAAALFSLLSALRTRASSAPLRTAWRGNLSRVIPIMAALCAVAFLGSGLVAAHTRTVWLKAWQQGKAGSFAMLKGALGPAWDNPRIPAGAWRAEYPPAESGN